MKKIIYLLTTSFLFFQSAQAGKYFNYFTDEEGNKTILFKKSGKKFNMALGAVAIHARKHEFNKIVFHEDVLSNQQDIVLKRLREEFNLVHLGNGLLEDAEDFDCNVRRLNKSKTNNIGLSNIRNLDLRGMDSSHCRKYLPLANQIIEGMDEVEGLSFNLSTMDQPMREFLADLLLQNNGKINRIFFYPDDFSPSTINGLLLDLLLMPGKLTYYFAGDSHYHPLGYLTGDFLDEAFEKLTSSDTSRAEWLQTYSGKKVVVPHANCLMEYAYTHLKPYKNICCDPQYTSIFKASYVTYENENTQKKHLEEMLTTDKLDEQWKKMGEIFAKEESKFKALSPHKKAFEELRDILFKQLNSIEKNTVDYNAAEEEKRSLINDLLKRM